MTLILQAPVSVLTILLRATQRLPMHLMEHFGARNDTYGESGYIKFHVAVINIFCSFFSTYSHPTATHAFGGTLWCKKWYLRWVCLYKISCCSDNYILLVLFNRRKWRWDVQVRNTHWNFGPAWAGIELAHRGWYIFERDTIWNGAGPSNLIHKTANGQSGSFPGYAEKKRCN